MNENELPPLPEPDFSCGDMTCGEWAYTAAQMRAYALAAVAQAKENNNED